MSRKKALRAAQGSGTIRKKTITQKGRQTPFGRAELPSAMTVEPANKFKNRLAGRLKRRFAKKCRP